MPQILRHPLCPSLGQGGVVCKEPFVLPWKGLANAVRKEWGLQLYPTLQLANPRLTLLVERDWDRQRKREKCNSQIPATGNPSMPAAAATFASDPGAFRSNPEENSTDFDTSAKVPQFCGQCQEAPVICCQGCPLKPAASSAGFQTRRPFLASHSLCKLGL